MEEIRFSIITPVHVWNDQREEGLKRCIESVNKQTFDHNKFEHIIVNDGSTREVKLPEYSWIKVINKNHEERLLAYNAGFKSAKGEIFVLLDSDDEYDQESLEKIDKMFKDNPEYKMFNYGCVYIHKDGGTNKRDPFKPKMIEVGHEVFGGGNVVNGTFTYHRSVYDDLGAFPEGEVKLNVPWYKKEPLIWWSPYDFSAYAQATYPEIMPFFMTKHPDHPAGLPKELGNPYGQDYFLFYKYTRKYHSKPIDEYLYIVHLR